MSLDLIREMTAIPRIDEESCAPKRGRRPDPTRTSRIRRAAQTLFSLHGFDRVSMDAIAAEAGTVKATVYKHFDNKEALFDATLAALLRELPAPETLIPKQNISPYPRLLEMAYRVHALMTGSLIETLHQMLSLPMKSASEHKGHIWDSTFQCYLEAVRTALDAENLERRLTISDANLASSMFFALVVGSPAIRAYLTGKPISLSPGTDSYLREAVKMYLIAHQGVCSDRSLAGETL